MKKIYFIIPFILFITILFLIYNVFSVPKKYTKNLFYMDTYINIVIYSKDKELVNDAFSYLDELYSDYHKLTDRYEEYDDILNIYYINNILEINEELVIDEKLYNLLVYGDEQFLITGGKINIAMGNMVDVWKKYRDLGYGIPTDQELDVNININDLILNDEKKSIKKTGDVSIDLGALAKGYVTDIAKDYLKSAGLDKYLISAGGNVLVGNHYADKNYRVGIEEPIKNSNELYKIINVTNKAVVTSGSYERFYEYDGEIYHHIIDPDTGFPPSYMKSVTVMCDNSAYADVLSTYLFLMNIDEGIDYINSLEYVEAVWYGIDDQIYTSIGFEYYE